MATETVSGHPKSRCTSMVGSIELIQAMGGFWSLVSGLARPHDAVECDLDNDGMTETFTIEERQGRWFVAEGDPLAAENGNRLEWDGGFSEPQPQIRALSCGDRDGR